MSSMPCAANGLRSWKWQRRADLADTGLYDLKASIVTKRAVTVLFAYVDSRQQSRRSSAQIDLSKAVVHSQKSNGV